MMPGVTGSASSLLSPRYFCGSPSNFDWHPDEQKYQVLPACSLRCSAVWGSTDIPQTGSFKECSPILCSCFISRPISKSDKVQQRQIDHRNQYQDSQPARISRTLTNSPDRYDDYNRNHQHPQPVPGPHSVTKHVLVHHEIALPLLS